MRNENSTTTIRKDEAFSITKNGQGIGKRFPWVLTLNAGTDAEYTMEYETIERAAEAAKSFHGME